MDYKEIERELFNRNKQKVDIEVFSNINLKRAIKEEKEKNRVKVLYI